MAAYYYQGNSKPNYYDNQQDTRVVMQPESVTTTKAGWNWCAHGWSMFAIFCCPWCLFSWMFAFSGLVCAIGSYSDHKAGDFERARYKKACAIGWTVVAILLGAATLAGAGYFIYFYLSDITDAINSAFDNVGGV